jgi:LPXTG-motif cell wall-anchored protein
MELQFIVCHQWWEFSPLSHSPVTVSRRRLTFIDAVELSPGMIFSVAVSGGPTTSTATPKPIRGHCSKAGLIAEGIVIGIAGIILAVAALLFYRRRRRSQASSAAQSAPESAGGSLSGYPAYNTPTREQIPSRASSRRYSYTPVPASQPHG